jgi:ABC-type transport system substrate-binding protein
MKKALFPLAILVLFFSLLTGCSNQSSITPSQPAASKSTPAASNTAASTSVLPPAAKTPVYGGTFRYITASGPSAFGVPWVVLGGSTFPMQFCLQTLIREMLDTSMQLGLAESYSTDTSTDHPSLRLLRKGIKFP